MSVTVPPLSPLESWLALLFVAVALWALVHGAIDDYKLAQQSETISQRPIATALVFMSLCRFLSFAVLGALLIASRSWSGGWFILTPVMWAFHPVDRWLVRQAFQLMSVTREVTKLRDERQESLTRKMRADDLRRLNEERDFVRNIVKQAYSR